MMIRAHIDFGLSDGFIFYIEYFFGPVRRVSFFFSSRNPQPLAITFRQENGSLAVAFELPDRTFIARVNSSTRKEYGVD